MDIFSVLSLLGGLALFLFGMALLGEGLERRAGGKLKSILARLTASPAKGFLLGLGVTAIIQSSSATTVMVVGFVNSGIMKLEQAIGIIMGANVGTTVTSWILSLTGIQGDSFFIKLLKPSSFTPVLAVIGMVMYMFSKNKKKKDTGTILLGFAVLMFGMEAMSAAVTPLAQVPEFTNILLMFSNPILGVLAGALLTGIIQSSSASVGILQALSSTGSVTFGSAIPIIMGQNIGTCVTALISSVGTNKNARRAAVIHLCFNIIGTFVFLSLFYLIKWILATTGVFDMSVWLSGQINQVGIAIVHTSFNLLATALMLPFTKGLERLSYMIIRDTEEDVDEFQFLDERLLSTPSVAIEQCSRLTAEMANISKDCLFKAISLIKKYDEKAADKILKKEQKVDEYEDKLGSYLVKLSSRNLSMRDSHEISKLLHTIGDFERISDHAVNILRSAEEIHEKGVGFSEGALKELDIFTAAVEEIVGLSIEAFQKRDLDMAFSVEPLEQVVDYLRSEIKSRHVERLQSGVCTIEMGFILSDLLNNCERVADHCSNIAACLIQVERDSFNTHEYLNEIKTSGGEEYTKLYEAYSKKYAL